jgi:hypothetical protein
MDNYWIRFGFDARLKNIEKAVANVDQCKVFPGELSCCGEEKAGTAETERQELECTSGCGKEWTK